MPLIHFFKLGIFMSKIPKTKRTPKKYLRNLCRTKGGSSHIPLGYAAEPSTVVLKGNNDINISCGALWPCKKK